RTVDRIDTSRPRIRHLSDYSKSAVGGRCQRRPMTTTSTTPLKVFTDRADRFTAILEGARGAWAAPTPCDGWTVRDVVAHVIETEREFFERQGLEPGPVADMADPIRAWHLHRARATEVLASEGVADRAYDGYFGPTT